MSEERLYLAHYGIKGQKWGVRRYQNEDGSFTEAGKARYAKLSANSSKYEAKAARARTLESKYEYKRDKTRSRWFQTDLSIARAKRYDKKRARQNILALKYESLSKRYDASAKAMIARSKADKIKYDKMIKKRTEAAVDDYIEVMNGNMSRDEYNDKYEGTGYRIK